ncbi:MAG TPA: ABC transporter permease [Planctomycetota bacterium]|nr:ABC transporter permease [Planctomycetota bacterium]
MTGPAPEAPPDEPIKGRSLWQDAMRRLVRNRAAVASAIFLVLLTVGCIAVPMFIDHNEQHTNAALESPGWSEITRSFHPFGTDDLGRDLFARCFYGGRISLMIGVVATFISIVIGTIYGAIAGYMGGWVDNVMMRVVDILYGVPYMLVVLLIMAAVAERGIVPLFGALALFQWLTTARIVRGQVLTFKNREFVQAARTVGASGPRIVFRHLLPNTMGPVIVYSTLMIPSIILQEAFLSYLGLGVQDPPHTSWGLLASDGTRAINPLEMYWWLLVFPALFLGTTLLAFNFLGDGLRDAFDPKGRRA